MDCREITGLISDYVDGQLPPEKRRAVEAHWQACPACRAAGDDVQSIVRAARTLPTINPDDRLWTTLQERLAEAGARGIGRSLRSERKRPRIGWLAYPRFALAAAALLMITVSVLLLLWKTGTPGLDHEKNAQMHIREAEMHYQQAIDSLSQVAARRKSSWDPQLTEVFEANLQKIDQAIAECKEAVRKSPNDPEAGTFLLAAYGRKVEFLQEMLQIGS